MRAEAARPRFKATCLVLLEDRVLDAVSIIGLPRSDRTLGGCHSRFPSQSGQLAPVQRMHA